MDPGLYVWVHRWVHLDPIFDPAGVQRAVAVDRHGGGRDGGDAGPHELPVLGGWAGPEDARDAVVRRLTRTAPCPVLVLTAAIHARPRVLAAVDVSDPAPTRPALAGKIPSTASDVARLLGGELHALHV